jgi:hypothetical protein
MLKYALRLSFIVITRHCSPSSNIMYTRRMDTLLLNIIKILIDQQIEIDHRYFLLLSENGAF